MGKAMNGNAKWIGSAIGLVLLTAAAVGAHFSSAERISTNTIHCEETARKLVSFEDDTDRDFHRLRQWMKSVSTEQNKQGNAIAAIAAHLKVTVPD